MTASEFNSNIRDAVNFFIARPMAFLRQGTNQSVVNSTWSFLLWDIEDLDRDGMHSTVTNTNRLTAQTAGWYRTSTTVNWASNNTGFRALAYDINAGSHFNKVTGQSAISAVFGMCQITMLFLNAGDYFEAVVWQNSGAALSTQSGDPDGAPRLDCEWLSTA